MVESSQSPSIHYFVCVDGSEASHFAYLVTVNGLLREQDQVTVAHTFSRLKDYNYLPLDMQPQSIKQTYSTLILGLGHRANIAYEELAKGQTTKDGILEIAARYSAQIIVVGMHGRKGPKEDQTILGSAVWNLSVNPVCPVLIIKDKQERSQKTDGIYRWAVCTDGSELSLQAFHLISTIMDRSKDEIYAITVQTTKIDGSQVKHQVDKKIAADNLKGKFVLLQRSNELEPVHKTIVNYLVNGSDQYIDFVAVGNQGADFSSHIDKRYLGNVASGVIRTPKLNVLFIPSMQKTGI